LRFQIGSPLRLQKIEFHLLRSRERAISYNELRVGKPKLTDLETNELIQGGYLVFESVLTASGAEEREEKTRKPQHQVGVAMLATTRLVVSDNGSCGSGERCIHFIRRSVLDLASLLHCPQESIDVGNQRRSGF
jgi:hypothetical protein